MMMKMRMMTYIPKDIKYVRDNTPCPFCATKTRKIVRFKNIDDHDTIEVNLSCKICKFSWVHHLTNNHLMRLEKIAYQNSSLLTPGEYDNILKEIETVRKQEGYDA